MAEAVKPDVILALIGTEQRAALLGVCVWQVRDAGGVLRIELCDLGGPWRPAVEECAVCARRRGRGRNLRAVRAVGVRPVGADAELGPPAARRLGQTHLARVHARRGRRRAAGSLQMVASDWRPAARGPTPSTA